MQSYACAMVLAVVGASGGGVPVDSVHGATGVPVGRSVAPKTLAVLRAATVETAARLSAPAASSVFLMPAIVTSRPLHGRNRQPVRRCCRRDGSEVVCRDWVPGTST